MAELVPEEYARRTESAGGYNVAITSYRLGATYHAKAEIDIPGAGARITSTQDKDCSSAEARVLAEARRLITRDN